MLYHRRKAEATNIGTAIARRRPIGCWSRWKASAIMSRALLKAVSPEVIGAATTPRRARMPPKMPSQPLDTLVTTAGADAVMSEPTCAAPPSKKNHEDTAAQMRATRPSVIMAP